MAKNLLTIILVCIFYGASAQQSLLNSLDKDSTSNKKEDVTATFKTTRLITGQSVELNHGGVLNFFIQHRFGTLNQGTYQLFGLDEASIRFSLELGLTNRLNIGVGRSSVGKIYDGYIKYKLLKQKIGGCPITITLYSTMEINSSHFTDPDQPNYFSSRLYFVNQVLIGSKISQALSLQLAPTIIHRNLVANDGDKNDILAIGVGGRQKISKRVSINVEYYYVLPNQIPSAEGIYNSLSIGFDIETGGHVFQLHLTNSNAMDDKGFITETNQSWLKGGFMLGFNISRVFTVYQWHKDW